MNVPYDFQANKALANMESAYTNVGAPKGKTHAMQMYVSSSSNSPNSQSYGVTTPSPPLRAISTRALSKNGTALVPSPLTMPQYSQQEPQAQNQLLVQASQSPQIHPHGPNGQTDLSQRHSQHGLQSQHQQQSSRHSPQLQQPQIHPSQANHHLSQQQQLQQHFEQSRRSAQHGYAPAEPLQKADSLHSFVSHDPQLDEHQYQHSPSIGQGRPLHNGTSHDRIHQVSHIYDSHDASAQDPQLSSVHHQNHHYEKQSQQQQQQLAQMQFQQQLQRHHHQLGSGQLSHHMQMGQQVMTPSTSGVHDPRLSGDIPQDLRNMHIQGGNVFQHTDMHAHPNVGQNAQNLAGTVSMQQQQQQQQQQSMQQQVLVSVSQNHALGSQVNKSSCNPALALLSKMVSNADDGVKKKRGRPKKLILDPSTNQFIDSSHENFKKLNKLLKQNSDGVVKQGHSPMENGLRLDSLNDEEMRQLLSSKDRRGRPRKFPVEQTGITIKGVRVAGSLKSRKKESPILFDAVNQVQKKKRGRPKGKTAAVS